MKKPYEGLQPGTEAWLLCWIKYPWFRNEMLKYHLQWELENYDREQKRESRISQISGAI